MWWVYLLRCKDGSLYTGITNDLDSRLSEHQSGKGGRYTRSHLPVKLIYQESHASKSEALRREVEIKSWSRQQKLLLIKQSDIIE